MAWPVDCNPSPMGGDWEGVIADGKVCDRLGEASEAVVAVAFELVRECLCACGCECVLAGGDDGSGDEFCLGSGDEPGSSGISVIVVVASAHGAHGAGVSGVEPGGTSVSETKKVDFLSAGELLVQPLVPSRPVSVAE